MTTQKLNNGNSIHYQERNGTFYRVAMDLADGKRPALTDDQKAKIGADIAELFCMKRSRDHKDRFDMAWGNKTALGVYETFKRVADEIESGTLKV